MSSNSHVFIFFTKQTHRSRTGDETCGLVLDASLNGGVVVGADESWQLGLHHEVLLCYGCALYQSVTNVFGVGKAEELPLRQTLGQGETYLCIAFRVGVQVGVEESRLVEVFANARFYVSRFFNLSTLRFFSIIDCQSGNLSVRSQRSHVKCLVCFHRLG